MRPLLQALTVILNRRTDRVCREIELGLKESVRVDRFDVVRVKLPCREILQVKRDDGVRMANDRGGKHMPVIGVGQHERLDQRFVARDD